MRPSPFLFLTALSFASAPALSQGAADQFDFDVTPDFRGTAHAEFAGWDLFSVPFGGANLPDDPSTTATAEVTQLIPGAILTSTGNIYHPAGASAFEIAGTVPSDAREVVLQLRTLASPLDLTSVSIEVDGPSGSQTLLPTDYVDLNGGSATAEHYFRWDLRAVGAGVTSYTVRFDAIAAHMSLDAVLLDLRLEGAVGTSYCAANANSTGAPGAIEARGSDLLSANDVTLVASSLPTNSAGFFLASLAQGFVAGPGGSQGNLCLSGTVGRFDQQVFNAGAAGTGSISIDLNQIPQPTGLVGASAGETWNFQCWYRDASPTPTSNFTDAVSVTLL